MELDALAQFDGVLRWAVCLCRLGKAVSGHWLELLVKGKQRLERGHESGLVGFCNDVVGIEQVVGTTDNTDLERSALFRSERRCKCAQRAGGHDSCCDGSRTNALNKVTA